MSKIDKVPNLEESFSEIKEIVDGMRGSAWGVVATIATTIKEAPSILSTLDESKVTADEMSGVTSLLTTIAKDGDRFTKELDTLDAKFSELSKDTGKASKKNLARNYTRMLSLSTQYHDVSTRLATSTETLIGDYTDTVMDLCAAPEKPAVDTTAKDTLETPNKEL